MAKKRTHDEVRRDNELIDAAGAADIARVCEVSPQAVSQWRIDGIPDARRMYLRLTMPEVFAAPVETEGAV